MDLFVSDNGEKTTFPTSKAIQQHVTSLYSWTTSGQLMDISSQVNKTVTKMAVNML